MPNYMTFELDTWEEEKDMCSAVEEIDTNEKGGMQSKLDTRYDIIPLECLRDLAEIFAKGAAKYAKDNWKLIDSDSHFNHMMTHYVKEKLGIGGNEDHAKHFLCRAVMCYYMMRYGK